MAVADVELTVDIAGGAIEVSLNGEGLGAVTVEGIDDAVVGDRDGAQVGVLVIDEVHRGGESTALGVVHGADGEVEFPAAILIGEGSGTVEAEVDNVDLAVRSDGSNVAISRFGLVSDGALILPLGLGSGGTNSVHGDGVVEAVFLHGLLAVVLIESVPEGLAIGILHLDVQAAVAAGVVTVLGNLNVVGELSAKLINR